MQEGEAEGGDPSKPDGSKKPTGLPLFDDEFEDSKANVKEKAEELRKQGCKCNHFPAHFLQKFIQFA